MHEPRHHRSIFRTGLAAAALLAGACSGAVSPDPGHATQPPAKPLPTAAAPNASAELPDGSPKFQGPGTGPSILMGVMLAVGRAGDDQLHVIDAGRDEEAMAIPVGAPDDDWGRVVTVATSGPSTEVREINLVSDVRGDALVLDGHWRLPTLGDDPMPVGYSANHTTVVLVPDRAATSAAPAKTSSFAVLHEGAALGWELGRVIELPGSYEYDALSPDGSILYVVEHLDATAGGRYQVRSIDVNSGAVDPTVISDKRFANEPMAGAPITQLRRTDGMVLTLYRGPDHPFVHALNSKEKWALCIDLPAEGAADAAAGRDWGLAQSADGSHVFAVNATLGTVSEIDPAGPELLRSAKITGITAGAGPAIVLAKFGHDAGGPVGRRAVVTPSGRTIIAGGQDGLVAIATHDFSTQWHALPGTPIRAVAVSPDGATAFVLLASGRITAVSTVDGAVIATLGSEGFDRLLAVMG